MTKIHSLVIFLSNCSPLGDLLCRLHHQLPPTYGKVRLRLLMAWLLTSHPSCKQLPCPKQVRGDVVTFLINNCSPLGRLFQPSRLLHCLWQVAKLIIVLLLTILGSFIWAQPLPPPSYEILTQYRLPIHQELDSNTTEKLKKWSKTQSDHSLQTWAQYKLAQIYKSTAPLKSCQFFKQLSKNSLFPLSDVADLRAQEICPHSSKGKELNKETIPPSNQTRKTLRTGQLGKTLKTKPVEKKIPTWLKDLNISAQIATAKNTNDIPLLMDSLIVKSKRSLPPSEKVSLVKEAINLAQKHKLHYEPIKQRLYQLAPRFIPQPKPSQYLLIANDWLKIRQFDKSLSYYKRVIHGNFTVFQKIAAFQGACRLHKLKRDHPSYLQCYIQFSHFMDQQDKVRGYKADMKTQELYLKVKIKLAKIYWTQNQRSKGRKILKKIQEKFQKIYPMNEVYFIRGKMHEEKGNLNGALWWYNLALKEEFKNEDFKKRLLWHKAWNLRKLKKYSEAIDTFSEIIKITEKLEGNTSGSTARYLYWRASSHRDLKQEAQAKADFEELIEKDPMGFYGLLAHRTLGRPIQWPQTKPLPKYSIDSQFKTNPAICAVSRHDTKNKECTPPILYLQWLLSLSENKIAKTYLDHLFKSNHNFSGKILDKPELWIPLFQYYTQMGHYLKFFYQLSKTPPDLRKQLLSSQPEMIFPRPFDQEVQQASKRFDVQANYIYSIMRQESAFNTRARSSADAFGLLQVLPELGTTARQTLNIPYYKMEDLYNPSINIQAGTSYLKQLFNHYDNQFILATAAYNANKKAVHNWIKTRYKGSPLEFIEDIPYQETRTYVKLVIRNFISYKILSHGKKPMFFPESCLKMKPMM